MATIKNESLLITAALQVGLVDIDSVNDLRKVARQERKSIFELLMRTFRFPESAFYQALAQQYDLPYIQPQQLVLADDLVAKVSIATLVRKQVFPIYIGEQLYLAMLDPNDRVSLDLIQRTVGKKVLPAIAEPDSLKYALDALDKGDKEDAGLKFDSVAVFDEIMKQSYVRRASDIHIEPGRDFTRIRMRVDGLMQVLGLRLSQLDTEALVNRVKVLGGMDISEQRLPQDGGLSYAIRDWNLPEMDIRVASSPTRWGERVTMRILGDANDALTIDQLDMPEHIAKKLRETLNLPHGMFLVTGPTGSGKSTTLYACIRDLNANEMNILTAEDPIEQTMSGISQVQMTSKLKFSDVLRSFLRHDPDVILVGEIRDLETAETALKASMTGHLVMSTLHTNNAISAVSRLVNLGCDRYLVGTTVVGIMAQRLVGKLCDNCKVTYEADNETKQLLGIKNLAEPLTLYKPKGCPVCGGTGYLGRLGLYEVLWVDHKVSEAIVEGVSEKRLRESPSFFSLWDSAKQRVLSGQTSLENVRYFHLDTEDEILDEKL
ncbi:GspE/PulE family protein [Thiomicrorhabdus hydrogeniphila]